MEQRICSGTKFVFSSTQPKKYDQITHRTGDNLQLQNENITFFLFLLHPFRKKHIADHPRNLFISSFWGNIPRASFPICVGSDRY